MTADDPLKDEVRQACEAYIRDNFPCQLNDDGSVPDDELNSLVAFVCARVRAREAKVMKDCAMWMRTNSTCWGNGGYVIAARHFEAQAKGRGNT